MEANRVDPDPDVTDEWGLPVPRMTHRQHPNDVAMSRWYADRMLEIGDAAGAVDRWIVLRVTDGEPRKGGSHLHGTCRMGEDPLAVVDSRLRVHGLSGIRVVDASVMPEVTTGNTNAPTIMIGERVSDLILEDAV